MPLHLRLELWIAARSQRQDQLSGLRRIKFHIGVQILEAILVVRAGDQRRVDEREAARRQAAAGPPGVIGKSSGRRPSR